MVVLGGPGHKEGGGGHAVDRLVDNRQHALNDREPADEGGHGQDAGSPAERIRVEVASLADALRAAATNDSNGQKGVAGPVKLGSFTQFGALGEPIGEKYDVFISHAGTEKPEFVDFLVEKFEHTCPNVRVFLDRDSLQPGDTGSSHRDKGSLKVIYDALEDAFVTIVVLSKTYLQRSDPLDELHLVLERLRCGCPAKVVPVFYDVQWSEVREQVHKYEELAACRRAAESGRAIESLAIAATNVLQQCAKDVGMLTYICGFTAEQVPHGRATKLIPEIVQRAAELLHELGQLRADRLKPHGPNSAETFVGLADRLRLLEEQAGEAARQGRALLLCGVPGIGKTTLATEFFNHRHKANPTVPCCFLSMNLDPRPDRQYSSIDDRHVLELQHQLLEDLVRLPPELMPKDIASGQDKIEKQFTRRLKATGRRVVLVVDNVWRGQLGRLLPDNIVEVLAPDSMVLIVSRGPLPDVCSPATGRKPVVHTMSCLTPAESTQLFRQLAPNAAALDGELMTAVQRCGGLPAALVAVAETVRQDNLVHSRQVDELLSSACGSSPYATMLTSWDALGHSRQPAAGTAEEQQTLLDVACFLQHQVQDRADWLEPYCRSSVLQRLQEVGLLDISPLTREGEGGGEQRVVHMHPAVTEFCRLASSLEQFWTPMKKLPVDDDTLGGANLLDEVENVVGLGLKGCMIVPGICEVLRTNKHLRIIQMDQNQCNSVLQLPSARWTCCNKDVMPATVSLQLAPSPILSRPNWAVVALQNLDHVEAATILRSKQLKRLRLEGCLKLKSITVSGMTTSLVRLEVVKCGSLAGLSGLHQLKRLHVECDTPVVLAALPGLTSLTLEGPWPELPNSISSIAALQELKLHYCPGLATLPGPLTDLQGLTQLSVVDCPSLQHLVPPTTLRQLSISSCPSLTSVVALAAAAQQREHQQQQQQQPQQALHIAASLSCLSKVDIINCQGLQAAPCAHHLPAHTTLAYNFESELQQWAAASAPCRCLAPS